MASGRSQTFLGGGRMNTNGKSPGTGHAAGSKSIITTTSNFTENARVSQQRYSDSPRAGFRRCNPKAVPNWARLGGFACAGCEQQSTAFGGVVTPAGWVGASGLGVCKICALRLEQQPPYLEEVGRRVQCIADALGLRPGQFDAAPEFAVRSATA